MPKAPSRSRQRAPKLGTRLRQEQIAEAALALLGTQGAKGLSVAAVARRVGLVPSAIYRHFGSIEDVVDLVFDLIGQRLMANVGAACREAPDAMGRLQQLLERHIDLIQRNPGIPSLMFSDDAFAARPQRKARAHAMVRAYLAQVERIIAEGRRSGQVRSDVEPQAGAMLFLGVIQPAAFLWHLGGGAAAVAAQAHGAWKLARAALAPPPRL